MDWEAAPKNVISSTTGLELPLDYLLEVNGCILGQFVKCKLPYFENDSSCLLGRALNRKIPLMLVVKQASPPVLHVSCLRRMLLTAINWNILRDRYPLPPAPRHQLPHSRVHLV